MATKERQFSSQVRSDLALKYGDDIHVELVPDMMRTGHKPYDFYFNYKDHFTGVECKLVDGNTFNFNSAFKNREHQFDSLKLVIRSGGSGLFLIGFNKHKTSFIMTPGILEVVRMERGDSVKIDVFREYPDKILEMPRGKIETTAKEKTHWYVEILIDAARRF